MNFLSKIMFLLVDPVPGGTTVPSDVEGTWMAEILGGVAGFVDAILTPILFLVAIAGIIYAIILGVNYSKAETTDKKEEAKKRIINAIIGMVVMLVLIIVLKIFAANVDSVITWVNTLAGTI